MAWAASADGPGADQTAPGQTECGGHYRGAVVHPLRAILHAAAGGRHLPVDGSVTFVPELGDGMRAVVALTGHAVVATGQDPATLADLSLDGFGSALAPAALLRIADGRTIGSNDVILVGRGYGGRSTLGPTDRWDDHPRVRYARSLRTDVRVHGDEAGFFTLADGLAGRRELGIELADPGTRPGLGRALLREALRAVEPGSWLFAAVAPGNARSLRAFLAAGFTPIGSEVILSR